MDLNKVMLIGRLGGDPELRHTQSGAAVGSATLATSERWTDKQGEKQERTEWHRLTMWGRTAEVAVEYCKKGSLLYVEGKLQTEKWTDKEGVDRWTTKVIVSRLSLGPRSENVGSSGGGQGAGDNYAPSAQPSDEDIPF